MDLDLRLIRSFVVVAEELHFGRAAAKLYISQPALTKQVRKLEEQLGAPLLVRDTRHVRLTARGQRLLVDARPLLVLADRIQNESLPNVVRVAHVFELQTTRLVVDSFASEYPDIELVERNLTSMAQLDALLNNHLDVAMLRVTAPMVAENPTGWHHRLLRLEPMLLVGRRGDPERAVASLHERPVEVFADSIGSGNYNAHGSYMTALERDTGLNLRWLGNPGPFAGCLAAVLRATSSAFVLEFDSYAHKYAEAGLPLYRPSELAPYYPWSIAWRDEPLSQPITDLIDIAEATAVERHWRTARVDAPAWVPSDDPDVRQLAL